MKDRAYAKVNLALDIMRRREDGYHELSSIMVPLNFYDLLEINKAEETSYECDRSFVPFNSSNTIVKMIGLFKEKYGISDRFEVKLEKKIPIKAGLAGGSADASAALRILQKMYHIEMSEDEIRELCGKVGSDVLFTYYNRPALVEGTGEKLTFFDIRKKYYVLLVKPSAGISTKESYGNLDLSICPHPEVYTLKEKLEQGEDIIPYLGNSLEQPADLLCREVGQAKKALLKEGALFAMMSGSGSTVFTLSESETEIRKLYESMKKYRYFTRFTEFLC